MWGEPLLIERGPGQKPLKMLLFDTEGFEATGKADAYDDRIFALSTIMSAVLVYNLPETVRESDVQVIWQILRMLLQCKACCRTHVTEACILLSADSKVLKDLLCISI